MKKYFLTALCLASCGFAFADGEENEENQSCESTYEARWVCLSEDQYNAAYAVGDINMFQGCGQDCDCDGDVCKPPKQDD